MYKIGTLAKKTGYSPNLLRVWEKRYGFLTPLRGAGGQRLYPEEDLRLLLVIRSELAKGRSIGELAQLGRAALLLTAATPVGGAVSQPQPVAGLEGYGAFIGLIVEAAAALDLPALAAGLDQAFARLSPEVVVHQVITPAMESIGSKWARGEVSVAGEHMVSSLVEHRLHNLLEASGPGAAASSDQTPVICACFPEEQHRLGILIIAYCLARQGLPVLYLGAALPFAALARAIRQVSAGSVWLSVTSPAILQGNRRQLLDLLAAYPQVRFILGGQAVIAEDEELGCRGCRVCRYPCPLPEVIHLLS